MRHGNKPVSQLYPRGTIWLYFQKKKKKNIRDYVSAKCEMESRGLLFPDALSPMEHGSIQIVMDTKGQRKEPCCVQKENGFLFCWDMATKSLSCLGRCKGLLNTKRIWPPATRSSFNVSRTYRWRDDLFVDSVSWREVLILRKPNKRLNSVMSSNNTVKRDRSSPTFIILY